MIKTIMDLTFFFLLLLLLALALPASALDDGAHTEAAQLLETQMQLEAAQRQAETFKQQAERAVQARLDAEVAHARQSADEQRENIATAAAASRPLELQLRQEKKREHALEAQLKQSQFTQARMKQDAERALASANAAMGKSETTAQQMALVEQAAKEKAASWEKAAYGALEILRKDRLDESQQWERLRHQGGRPSQQQQQKQQQQQQKQQQALLLETKADAAKPVSPEMLEELVTQIAQNARAERKRSSAALVAQQNSLRVQMAKKDTREKSDFDAFRNKLDSLDLDTPLDMNSLV
jgi:hypothetical protein